jgi:hypothetical protein
MDDISFAQCILSERRNKLNPHTPLAEKLKKATRTLDKLKGEIQGDVNKADDRT